MWGDKAGYINDSSVDACYYRPIINHIVEVIIFWWAKLTAEHKFLDTVDIFQAKTVKINSEVLLDKLQKEATLHSNSHS